MNFGTRHGRLAPSASAYTGNHSLDARRSGDGVLELLQRLDAPQPRPGGIVEERVILDLQTLSGRLVGKRDALRDDATRARRDSSGDEIPGALGPDPVVAGHLLLHLARVERRRNIRQLVNHALR